MSSHSIFAYQVALFYNLYYLMIVYYKVKNTVGILNYMYFNSDINKKISKNY